MCALLSPSFGAHLDCPPRPTEQWLYGWVDRYLNLSAMTITLPRIHTCDTLLHSHTSPDASAMLAIVYVCVCMCVLRELYIWWVLHRVQMSVVVYFVVLCLFLNSFVTVNIPAYFGFNSCLLFIILADFQYPSIHLSAFLAKDLCCCFGFSFSPLSKSLRPRVRSVLVCFPPFPFPLWKPRPSPSRQWKVSDYSIIPRTQGLCHHKGWCCEMCIFVCAPVQWTVSPALERKDLFVFHS